MATKNFHDEQEIIIPNNLVDLQEFLADLWENIFDNDQTDKIDLYNTAAKKYNKAVSRDIMELITNFKKQKNMATKKAAVKKAAPKKAAKKAAPKKAAAKKVAGEKKESQKEIIVRLNSKAGGGMNVDEIVAETGIKKTNVQWYFSKLGLKNEKREVAEK